MKKRIVPFGYQILLYGLLFLVISGVITYFIVQSFYGSPQTKVFRFALLTVLFLISLYLFISPMIFYTIRIKGNTISMIKDLGFFKEDKIQDAIEVDLEQIDSFKVILSEKNSKGEPYSSKTPKKKYVEFIMPSGEKKRIYVSLLTKKQLLSLVNFIEKTSGKTISNE